MEVDYGDRLCEGVCVMEGENGVGVARSAIVPGVWMEGKKALFLDPGDTNGVAKCVNGVLKVCEIHFGSTENKENVLLCALELARMCKECEILCIEDFILTGPARGGWSSDRRGLSPVSVTYALLGILRQSGWQGRVYWQTPAQKEVINNDRLKALGLYVKGSEHIRDALRHMELWRRTHG